jgi:hypothetical protein
MTGQKSGANYSRAIAFTVVACLEGFLAVPISFVVYAVLGGFLGGVVIVGCVMLFQLAVPLAAQSLMKVAAMFCAQVCGQTFRMRMSSWLNA